MTSYKVTTPATTDPVTLPEIKAHCRVTWDNEDAYLASGVKAATDFYQQQTNRQLVNATYLLTLREWGENDHVVLPVAPLSSLASVQYYDGNGTNQTWASSNYYVDTAEEPGRIYLATGATFPGVADRRDAIRISYVAGYGTPANVPALDKAAVKLMAANWFENREPNVIGTIVTELPLAVRSIIQSRRVVTLY